MSYNALTSAISAVSIRVFPVFVLYSRNQIFSFKIHFVIRSSSGRQFSEKIEFEYITFNIKLYI